MLLLSRLVNDDDEDDGGNDDDCAPNRPERSALPLLAAAVEPLFNFAAFDEDRGDPLLPLLPWSGVVAGRMLSPPMLILLLVLLLSPAEVLTAVAALLDFFKTCIIVCLSRIYDWIRATLLFCRWTQKRIN